jgi:uncharacterized phage protein gp47/JayE
MPWTTPTLKSVRELTRDYTLSQLGAKAMIPNSVLRIMSDAMSGLAHLTLLYIDWLAKQLLPDTAEQEWLDRHGIIWLKNADGSKGRKVATYANGAIHFNGDFGVVVPSGTVLTGPNGIEYQTVQEVTLGNAGASAPAVALTSGEVGNLPAGTALGFSNPLIAPAPAGVIETAECDGDMAGGVDTENDDLLRERVLFRIQKPPMGGDKDDYEAWTMSIPGVTRAWCAPTEMGPGTVTVRFMMDEVRDYNNGFPLASDCTLVKAYLDTVRPVAVKDLFVVSPIPMPVDMLITKLFPNTTAQINAIEASCIERFRLKAAPGQIFYRAWVDEAISDANPDYYDLVLEDAVPPDNGSLPVLGTINYLLSDVPPTEPGEPPLS